MDKAMRYGAYAGILWIILSLSDVLLTILKIGSEYVNLFLLLSIAATSIVFYWGLVNLGKRYDNNLIKYSAYFAMVLSLASIVEKLIPLESTPVGLILLYNNFVLTLQGIIFIFLGLGIIKIKGKRKFFKKLTQGTTIAAGIFGMPTIIWGVVEIISSGIDYSKRSPNLFTLTITALLILGGICQFISLLLMIMAYLLLSLLLYQESKENPVQK